MSLAYELISVSSYHFSEKRGRLFFQFCIDERIGYHARPDSFEKHESLSDSHIIKLLFWGIQFKLGLSSALVGEIELLCLRTLFDSGDSLRNLVAIKHQIWLQQEAQNEWFAFDPARAMHKHLLSSPKWVPSSVEGC